MCYEMGSIIHSFIGVVFYLIGGVGLAFFIIQIPLNRPSDGDPDGRGRRKAILGAIICFVMISIGIFLRKL